MRTEQVMYLAELSSSAIQLSPVPGLGSQGQAGLGIGQVRVTTTESTADAGFWGSVAGCSRFRVIFERFE